MIRSHDLAMDIMSLNQLINDPLIKILKIDVSCSVESGFTTAIVNFQSVTEPIKRRRERRFARYLLFGGDNPTLNKLLNSETTKLLNQHEFITEQGAIIVVDYEVKNERS